MSAEKMSAYPSSARSTTIVRTSFLKAPGLALSVSETNARTMNAQQISTAAMVSFATKLSTSALRRNALDQLLATLSKAARIENASVLGTSALLSIAELTRTAVGL